MGAQAWELINIPELAPRALPIFSQIDSQSICILGGNVGRYLSNGVVLNAETGAVVRVISPASKIKFECSSQSFMRTPGEIVSLVKTDKDYEVQMMCYNQASNKVTFIHNYGKW